MTGISVIGLFCEEVRQEAQGQDTLIGVFPDNVTVPGFPGVMPRLSIYLRYHIDINERVKKIQSRLIFPNKESTLLSEIDPKLITKTRRDSKANKAPIMGLISRASFSPFQVNEAGRILLIADIDGAEYIAAGLNFQTPKKNKK